jgi:hypothetical protein
LESSLRVPEPERPASTAHAPPGGRAKEARAKAQTARVVETVKMVKAVKARAVRVVKMVKAVKARVVRVVKMVKAVNARTVRVVKTRHSHAPACVPAQRMHT